MLLLLLNVYLIFDECVCVCFCFIKGEPIRIVKQEFNTRVQTQLSKLPTGSYNNLHIRVAMSLRATIVSHLHSP